MRPSFFHPFRLLNPRGMTMSDKNIRSQIAASAEIVKSWPEGKQNILTHSAQPTNSTARPPVWNGTTNDGQADAKR